MTRLINLLRSFIEDPRIFRNVVWSFGGTALPLVAAVIATPFLIKGMGIERFGVLSLAWIVTGYFSFFELGLGRAMTQLISQRMGNGRKSDVAAIAQTGIALMAMLGLAGGILVALISRWMVTKTLAIPDSLVGETLTSFYILSISIPIIVLSTGFRGILEALHRFDIVNLIRAPLGAVTYLGPLAILPFNNTLPPVVAALLAGRLLSLLAYALAFRWADRSLFDKWSFNKRLTYELLSFGGWMTLSNIAGPLLLYSSRMALAVVVSAEAVAYFSTPYDVIISILLIPGIFVSVLFPVFSERFAADRDAVQAAYRTALYQNLLLILPVCTIAFIFAKPLMTLWLGAEFAGHSYRVAQWLALGVFVNSFGYYAQALLQAIGRPDITAKLHVAELAAYLPYMMWLVHSYGIEGAAISWTIRVCISTIALTWLARQCLDGRIHTRHDGKQYDNI